MKKLLYIGLCLLGVNAWAVVPVRPFVKLRPLNLTLFNNKISAQVARQSFAQLMRAPQLNALTPAQQTLLLAHKFAQENHALPRTRISIDNKIVPPTKYTFAQKMEVSLGMKIRYLLKDPKTPPEIREEILQLQYDFSPTHTNKRTLDQLNEWLTQHNTWPRENIEHEGPLSEEEMYEMDLAKRANIITAGDSQLSAELIDQIRSIRSYYDPTYISLSQQEDQWIIQRAQQKQAIQRRAQRTYELEQYYYGTFYKDEISQLPRNYDFYANDNLPRNPATGRQQVLPTPEGPDIDPNLIESTYPVDQDQVYTTLVNLVHWLEKHPSTWPNLISTNSKTVKLAQEILLIKKHPIGRKELGKLKEQIFPQPNFTPKQLLQKLKTYIAKERRWPTARYITITSMTTSSSKDIREAQLANAVETFVCYTHPDIQGAKREYTGWWSTNSFMHRVLSSRKPYANPDLEQFRLLYQKYH